MATTIGLGVQFTANASGMTKGLSQVDRQLQRLGQQANGAASLFDSFTRSSEAAVQAQQKVATDLAFLNSAFRTGQVSAEQYATELKTIVADANASAAAFAEGARITQQAATAEEQRAATLERLGDLLQQGAISQQTYDRAAADASGANEAAAKAEADRASALARAAQITQANLSPQQKYDQEVLELNGHLQAGRITQDTYNAALQRAAQGYAKATVAAARYDSAADAAGSGNTLAFNELSGILSALPGPIGNVAGRLSGLSSAAEGLNRVFSGAGGGVQAFAGQIGTLVNPTTIAISAFTAFTAAGVAVAKNLVALEGEVERLGQLAERVGVSFQFIQVLDAAAKASGSSVESLGGAFNKFLRSLNDARGGSKAASDAFRTLGISSDDLKNKSPEALFKVMARSLSGIEDPAQRAAIAMDLFGKSGTELLPIFATLDRAASDLERIGGAITDQQAAQIQRFGDELDRLSLASKGASNQVTASFASSAGDVTKGTNTILSSVTSLISAFPQLGEAASTSVVRAIPGLNTLAAIGVISDSLETLTGRAKETADAVNGIVPPAWDGTLLAATQFGDEIDKASKKAAEFGQAGFDAAIAFQNQLEEIAQLQADGTLSADEAKKASENARKEFEANISVIEDESKARQKAAEEAQRAADAKVEADKRVADSALERLRIEEEFGGDSQRAQAAENVLAIQREIFRLEQQQQAAADASDAAEEARLSARLAGLDQVLAREQDIASGAAKSREENQKAIDAANQQLEEAFTFDAFQIAPDAFSAAQQQIDELRQSLDDNIIDGDTFRVAAQAVVDRFEEAKKVAEEIGKLEEKYAEKRAEIDRDRIEELATVSQKALQGNDVRTSEGASQFLALATGREDPAVAEYRKQLKELQDIKREIAKANAQPVQI
jgi:hypothetical protein